MNVFQVKDILLNPRNVTAAIVVAGVTANARAPVMGANATPNRSTILVPAKRGKIPAGITTARQGTAATYVDATISTKSDATPRIIDGAT